jgi:YidC/Oxa1 family membrane protein insertase
MNTFAEPVANLLAWIYNLVPNYALAIMILTLAIMIALTPLTLKGTRSMLAMQQLQPEMKKLQAKYKDDRQRLNEEMMAFYKEHKINPMSGCLPLLLQMPVFFVLYRVLYGLTTRAYLGTDMGALVGRVAGGNPAATYPSYGSFSPKYLSHTSKMYEALSSSNQMKSFGIDLSENAIKALQQGFLHALPFLVLIVLVTATSYIQQRQVTARTAGQEQNPQQQMLLKIMPLFFAFISLTLPGGVVVYFLVSNCYRVGQQAFITRTMYSDANAGGPIPATASVASGKSAVPDDAPAKPKGLLARLGIDPEAMPDVSGKKSGGSAGSSGSKAKGKPAAGLKGAGSGGKGTSTRTAASKSTSSKSSGTGNGAGGSAKRPARGSAAVSASGGSKKGTAPARSSPPPPANRSRDKKKRK